MLTTRMLNEEDLIGTGTGDTGVTETPVSIDWAAQVPEDLREKEYVKNILAHEKPGEELFRQFAGLQSKLGERPITIPKADSPLEDWEKFYSNTRPESIDAYQFDPFKSDNEADKELVEMMTQGRREDYLKGMKEEFHRLGIPPKVANELAKKSDSLTFSIIKEQMAQQATEKQQADSAFEDLLDKTFGKDKESAIQYGKKFLEKYTSDKTMEMAKKLPDEALVLIADMAMKFNKQYDTEDKFEPKPDAGAAGGESALQEALNATMIKLHKTDQFTDEYDNLKKEAADLSKKIAASRKR